MGGGRTLTLLFTDVEGSTRALQAVGDASYVEVLDVHLRLLRDAFGTAGGVERGNEGDALFYTFESATSAVRAAVAAQRSLEAHSWPEGAALRARIGLHCGEVIVSDSAVQGIAVHLAARVCSAAHGGQILLSGAMADMARGALGEGVSLKELGRFRLKDVTAPVPLEQIVAEGIADTFPRPRTLDASAHNLPVQPTPLVGRTRELEAVCSLVVSDDVRLVTLTGPGGIGKTRLAVQVAADVAERFEDGVWFIDLAPLRDPSHVATSVMSALGIEEQRGTSHIDSVIEHLADRRALLVLDNFEQLIEAADVVGAILDRCASTKVLTTSRALLRLRLERNYEVPSMPASSDATALFVQSATVVDPSFDLTDEAAGAISAICERLDGLPLAIELAASRTRMLSPVALLERLESKLDFLASDRRDAPERQRTMHSTISWSYELLTDDEKRVLRRLSIFRGGCSLEAAEAVGGPVELIANLVDRSLVRRSVGSDGSVRFGLLDTIGSFAFGELEGSGEVNDARSAMAKWFASYAARAREGMRGADQLSWLDSVEREVDNLRAVLSWGSTGDVEARFALGVVADLERFWLMRGYRAEIAPVHEHLLDAVREPCKERALGLLVGDAFVTLEPYAAAGLLVSKDAARLHPLYEEAVEIARVVGDDRLLARALFADANARRFLQGAKDKDYLPAFDEAIAVAQRCNDEELVLEIKARRPLKGIRGFFNISQLSGNYLADERIAAAEKRGDRVTQAQLKLRRAGRFPNDPDGSKRRMAEDALAIARELGDQSLEPDALLTLGDLAATRGDLVAARAYLSDAHRLYSELGDEKALTRVNESFLTLARAVGDGEAERTLMSRKLRESLGYRAGTFTARLFGLRGLNYAPGPLTLLAGAAWIVLPMRLPSRGAYVALALATWALSARMRDEIQWYKRRVGAGGSISYFTFTGLTLFAFFIAYLLREPEAGVLIVAPIALWRFVGSKAPHDPRVVGIATLTGLATIAFAAAGVVTGADVLAGISAVSFGVFVLVFGYDAKPGPFVWRIAQAGWFAFRFGWPMLAMTAFAQSRGLDMSPWDDWARLATPVGLLLFALTMAVAGETSAKAGAVLIAAGAVTLGLTINGGQDLLVIGGVLVGSGWLLLSLAPLVFPPRKLMDVLQAPGLGREALSH